MTHNPQMTSGERVLWRQVVQAAHVAAQSPGAVGKLKDLKKVLSPTGGYRLPDLRPAPSACFRAFLMMARGFALETEPEVRFALANRLAGLADAAGDLLDGLPSGGGDTSSWADRADLR